MNTTLMQSFITPGFLLLTGIILTSAILFFYYMYKREKEFQEHEGHLLQNYDQIIQQANEKAKDIIDQASQQAGIILSQAQTAKLNLDTKAGEAFKQITDEQIQLLQTTTKEYFTDYQSSLDEVKKHYAQQLGETLSDIRDATQKEIVQLKTILDTQVNQSQQSVSGKMQEEFSKTQVELNEYKRHQMQKIEAQINDLLIRVSEEILGKVIPLRDHQQLILESLESAKKEGMFTL